VSPRRTKTHRKYRGRGFGGGVWAGDGSPLFGLFVTIKVVPKRGKGISFFVTWEGNVCLR